MNKKAAADKRAAPRIAMRFLLRPGGKIPGKIKKRRLISAPLQESLCDSCSAPGKVCCRGEELIPSAALFIFLSGAAWTWVVAADFPVRVADGSGIFLLFIELFPAFFGQ